MVEDENGEFKIILIDFGFSKKYFTHDGYHIDDIELKESFQGNIMFSSLNQMEFKNTSRKDDMISLCYLMKYLLNGRTFPWFEAIQK